MFCVFYVVSRWVRSDWYVFFFQAEDGIRDLVRSRGLGDVYKRQVLGVLVAAEFLIVVVLDLAVIIKGGQGGGAGLSLSLIHI